MPLILLAAAGCTGDSEDYGTLNSVGTSTAAPASVPPPSAVDLTTAPAPVPTGTAPPAGTAFPDSPEGARRFAAGWLDALDAAYATGDTRSFRALGGCQTCVEITTGIDRLRRAGGRYVGGRITPGRIRTLRAVPGVTALVEVGYARAERRVVRPGVPDEVAPAEPAAGFLLTLQRRGEGWQVFTAQAITGPARFSVAAPDCRFAADERACAALGDGTITVGGRSGQPSSGADLFAAYCSALWAGAPPGPVRELCAGGWRGPTAAQVLAAFRTLALPTGRIAVAPPGWALVNVPIGVRCLGCGSADRTVTVAGVPVRLRPRVVGYGWRLDGAAAVAGGAAWTPVFARAGLVRLGLTVTWTADWSVAGGPFETVGGSATTTAPAVALRVRAAAPVLVNRLKGTFSR